MTVKLKPPKPKQLVRCPGCGSDLPNFRMVELTSHYLTGNPDKPVEERITGYRVACQNCATIYGIAAHGTLKYNILSRPVTPELEYKQQPLMTPDGRAQPEPIPMSQALRGRQRPGV